MSLVELLKSFYSHSNEYFILIRKDGIVMVELPDVQEGKPESVLRLFTNIADAARYKDRSTDDVRVHRTTLVGIWSLLTVIHSLSMKQYKCPVRVEVTGFDIRGNVITIDVLHSTYAVLS